MITVVVEDVCRRCRLRNALQRIFFRQIAIGRLPNRCIDTLHGRVRHELRKRHERARFIHIVRAAVLRALVRERVAIPTEQRALSVHALGNAPTQRIIEVARRRAPLALLDHRRHQAIERIPLVLLLTRGRAPGNEVAPLVIREVHPRVLLEQIAQDLRHLLRQRALFPRPVHRLHHAWSTLLRIGRHIHDIARRIERKALAAPRARRFDKPAHRVIPIVDIALGAVLDLCQLPRRIVAIAPIDDRHRRLLALQRRLNHPARRVINRSQS
ncbi:hypothetical protein LMG24076_05444 [Trinickia soli]|nr:hypothetical protein LMG24076_05444 [Trinickia soli]